MNEKWTPHIIAVGALVVFVVLGLGSATNPYQKVRPGENSLVMFSFDTEGMTDIEIQSVHQQLVYQGFLPPRIVEKGASIILPGGDGLSFGNATFVGWRASVVVNPKLKPKVIGDYKPGDSFTPPGGTVYIIAQWE